MNYTDWITRTLSKFQISPTDVELILFNQRLIIPDPNAEADVTTAKRAIVSELATIIPLMDIGEGGYSISWNWDAIKFWYSQTCAELGLTPVGAPTIRNRSNVW
jgi:hypothetical protein